MTTKSVPTRRSFIRTAGAALSVPLAAVAATVPAGAAGGRSREEPVAHCEDMSAIRALNQAYARHANAGATDALVALFADPSSASIDLSIRSVAPDGFSEWQDEIEVADDRQTATDAVRCVVQIETVIAPSCPLVEMAREQGGGVVTRTETGVFAFAYVRRDGTWMIQSAAYRPGEQIS